MSDITFRETLLILGGCHQEELYDTAFGDSEFICSSKGEVVASGYFGRDAAEVYVHAAIVSDNKKTVFLGEQAKALRHFYTTRQRTRNA